MSDESSEKKHSPSAKKLSDLKKQGQTLRSRDFTGGIAFITTMMLLIITAKTLMQQLHELFLYLFHAIQYVPGDGLSLKFISIICIKSFIVLVPVYICVLIFTLLSPYFYGGWNFSLESLSLKPERLDPISNLKNIFSTRLIKNVVKSLFKALSIISVLLIFTYFKSDTILELTRLPLSESLTQFMYVVSNYIFIMSFCVITFVAIDMITNYFEFQSKAKMTSQELKDEHKETEGNQDVKRKIKTLQIGLLRQRLHVLVPKSTVIITNPTHYAVALHYNELSHQAPKVLAKGKDLIASQIRKIANNHQIPIFESPILARAIYKTSKQNQEIRPELYTAVAIVLSYIHQLRLYQHGYAELPVIASDLKIPSEFIFND